MPLTLGRQRLFIACDLPVHIKTRLASLQTILQQSGSDTKWVEPHNIHLTLKFLGDTPQGSTRDIAKLLDKVFKDHKSFVVKLDRLSAFPSRHAPRIIWAGLENGQWLKKMAVSLETNLLALGFARDNKPFAAHMTLGRVRSPRNRAALADLLLYIQDNFKEEVFRIDNVTLFESRLSVDGPAYHALHKTKLA
jgi:2'-5' RNA ligase